MIPLTSALRSLAGLLSEWGQPHALIGGAALVARGRVRLTEDLDVTVVVGPGREAAFLALAQRHRFTWPEKDTPHFLEAGVLRVASPEAVSVDFITAADALYVAAAQRATPIAIDGTTLPVATVEDLMLMKVDAHRLIDLDDVLALKDIHGADLDRAYLAAAADQHGLRKQLEALLGPL